MTFVLVHGGAHGAWCWERMIPHLSHEAVAIDLPGRGERPAPLEEITADDWADAVAGELAARDLRDVVLVGHSLAGITLPRVAERAADRIARLVFVSCTVPPEGEAVLDVLSPEVRPLAQRSQRNPVASALAEEVARPMFCNDMDEEEARSVLDQLVPEAWGPMLEPNRLAGLGLGIPATYVKLLQDQSIPPDLQDQMIRNIGAPDAPDAPEVVELDAGHDAMISKPRELAWILEDLISPSRR